MKDASSRIPVYLEHIEQAAQRVGRYTAGMMLSEFCKNEMCLAAVVREIEIMGEASKRIRDARKELYPQGSLFLGAAKMRDRVIHKYDGVSAEIVWEAVLHDIPDLLEHVEKELASLDGK